MPDDPGRRAVSATSDAPAAASPPRPSATVVLLRDAPQGPETLLVLRHERASFGASYVFPGGVNEDADETVAGYCGDTDDAQLSARLAIGCGGLAYFSAAIRELFEETGVLLARRRSGAALTAADSERLRSALNDGELSWPRLLQSENLELACDGLHYFAYWVTPRHFDKRFSTRFFAAQLPPGQHAWHDGGELTDSCWMTPAAALASAADGQLVLPPPTRHTLERFAGFASVAAALDFAREREARGVDCILPAIVGDEGRIAMPGSADYPADHEGFEE